MRGRLLVIDDDPELAEVVRSGPLGEQYVIEAAFDGVRGLEKALGGSHDLVILDIDLPAMSGIDVCRALRERGFRVPILMLTGMTSVEDRVRGLEAGADDYLGKPFALKELGARIRALLRRRTPPETASPLVMGDLVLDMETREARVEGRTVALTAKEFDLLTTLMERPGRVLSRSAIEERVWGERTPPASNRVDVTIGRIRRKLDHTRPNRFIRTVRGVGYGLAV